MTSAWSRLTVWKMQSITHSEQGNQFSTLSKNAIEGFVTLLIITHRHWFHWLLILINNQKGDTLMWHQCIMFEYVAILRYRFIRYDTFNFVPFWTKEIVVVISLFEPDTFKLIHKYASIIYYVLVLCTTWSNASFRVSIDTCTNFILVFIFKHTQVTYFSIS